MGVNTTVTVLWSVSEEEVLENISGTVVGCYSRTGCSFASV